MLELDIFSKIEISLNKLTEVNLINNLSTLAIEVINRCNRVNQKSKNNRVLNKFPYVRGRGLIGTGLRTERLKTSRSLDRGINEQRKRIRGNIKVKIQQGVRSKGTDNYKTARTVTKE